eukprot:TRINITY_DN8270_c0_g1_i1.p2 TRINITY_DN8270_c0_g1~~TRINITY_DN8270_c0_g1_i1.p2  ORF type:complete len:156 (+),score=24.13 TRINITY_DN8270_c0_g1_i1:53-520(+)
MRSWHHFSGLLGPKFWKLLRREGIMRTLIRARPMLNQPHDVGGWNDVPNCVGSDEYGNRYYEDLTHYNFNTRRWVEYASVHAPFPNGKKVTPIWHGWLHYTYDDVPRQEFFVYPAHREPRSFIFESQHPKAFRNPGLLINPDRKKFMYIECLITL